MNQKHLYRLWAFWACVAWGLAVPAVAQSVNGTVVQMAKDMREEMVRIPATVKDLYGRQETKNIPVTIYRPDGEGPFPLLVFNHGRAVASKRAQQGLSRPETVARYFTAKGFVVMAPTRVGYAETYGDFDPEQSGSCAALQVEAMSIAASEQVLATVAYAQSLPFVDASRWIVAGQSVGGLASVATVGRAPAGLLAGINFSGGAGGDPDNKPGNPCRPQALESHWGNIAKQARAPMLWMYWQNDKYWGQENPKHWHKAWVAGGGKAELSAFGPSPGEDGHLGLSDDMEHWLPVVDQFLDQLGFHAKAMVAAPSASGFADIADLGKVPLREDNKSAYQRFLGQKLPRAFAISERGTFGFATGDYAVGRAIGNCARYGFKCALYAVDNDVVWTGK
jgi:dienelactone hydrolase